MPSLTSLSSVRRPVRLRVVVLYRLSDASAERQLPPELAPRLVHGSAIGTLSYTHLGSLGSRFLPARRASSHHVAYRVAATCRSSGADVTWVVRRETSSRVGARWSETILRRTHGRARFSLDADATGFELRAEAARRDLDPHEALYLRAAPCLRTGTLFPSRRDVETFFRDAGDVRPHDVIAREADRIDASHAFAPEPLTLFELRSAFFDDRDRFPDAPVIDGAWRLVPQRLRPIFEPTRARHGTLAPASERSRALPAL